MIEVTLLILFALAIYFINATGMMFAFRKADQEKPWIAYIPVIYYIPYFRLIGVSMWSFLWLAADFLASELSALHHPVTTVISGVIQIAFFVMVIIWQVRYFKSFGVNPKILFFYFLPIIGWIIIWVKWLKTGYSNKYTYQKI